MEGLRVILWRNSRSISNGAYATRSWSSSTQRLLVKTSPLRIARRQIEIHTNQQVFGNQFTRSFSSWSPWWWKESENAELLLKSKTIRAKDSSGARDGKSSIERATEEIRKLNSPDLSNMICLSLERRPFFPGMIFSFTISDPKVVKAIKEVERTENPYISMFLKDPKLKEEAEENQLDLNTVSDAPCDPSKLYNVGTLSQILEVHGRSTMMVEDHTVSRAGEPVDSFGNRLRQVPVVTVVVRATDRVKMVNVNSMGPPTFVAVEKVEDELPFEDITPVDAMSRMLKSSMENVVKRANTQYSHHLYSMVQRLETGRLVDYVAGFLNSSPEELQSIFEEPNVRKRMDSTLMLIRKEEHVAKLQREMGQKFFERIQSRNKSKSPDSSIKAFEENVKREYGPFNGNGGNKPPGIVDVLENRVNAYTPITEAESNAMIDPEEKLLAKIRNSNATFPPRVKQVYDVEISKLKAMDAVQGSDFSITRNYLEVLTSIPWNQYSRDILDIERSKEILDKEHYGMKDVKERILEFVSVTKLTGNVQGKILCFTGPPGTGKTSIGQSIAHSLGRKFYRFSVGGLYDVSELKGHRRTYVGALPGKIVQALRQTGTFNPVIMIDEVDKMGSGPQGDLSSAMLELLDPSQNHSFVDNYLDLPLDLTQVLFVCTANYVNQITTPLLDRMEVINLTGYDTKEKMNIAKSYIIPKAMKQSGFISGSVMDSDDKVALEDDIFKNLPEKPETPVAPAAMAGNERGQLVMESQMPLGQAYGSANDQSSTLYEVAEVSFLPENSSTDSVDVNRGRTSEQETKPLIKPNNNGEFIDPEVEEYHNGARLEPMVLPADFIENVGISDEAIEYITKWYSREPGMRNFGKYIEQIFRKLALRCMELSPNELTAERAQKDFYVKIEDLKDLIGHPPISRDTIYSEPVAGVLAGLAAGYFGGTTLYIETTAIKRPEKIKSDEDKENANDKQFAGGFFCTGLLGSSMKESTEIAYINARSMLQKIDPGNTFFEENQVHLHAPTAQEKDGPSAGVTMTTALLSLALDQPVPLDVTMTGEISLTGKVMQIGGVKDKILAARRAGLKVVFMPIDNQSDFEQLDDHQKEGLTVHYVDNYSEISDILFQSK